MATTTTARVVMKFIDEDEKDMTMSLSNAKSDVTAAAVKTFMDMMITKGDCFQQVPYEKVSAQVVVTETTDLDISD